MYKFNMYKFIKTLKKIKYQKTEPKKIKNILPSKPAIPSKKTQNNLKSGIPPRLF